MLPGNNSSPAELGFVSISASSQLKARTSHHPARHVWERSGGTTGLPELHASAARCHKGIKSTKKLFFTGVIKLWNIFLKETRNYFPPETRLKPQPANSQISCAIILEFLFPVLHPFQCSLPVIFPSFLVSFDSCYRKEMSGNLTHCCASSRWESHDSIPTCARATLHQFSL